ncbi:MAG: metalloregulator ArsR/SmtB family transcription factor [Fimbriimonas sp.]|nr:metalloregulator ArsR/SmtB family transcription factor [Fimbriimonas sp.]
MVQYSQIRFDASFGALSDPTRRGVLEQLVRADASITALAERFHMTLTGMKKHEGVLEQAGLVTTEKVGRVRTCKLGLRVPTEFGHPFQNNSATDSDLIRPPIPTEFGHPLRFVCG